MNSIDVKAEMLSYLRFVRQYPLVCVEQFDQDIIAVDGRRRMLWVEVKVSIGDLLNDRKKAFHQSVRQMKHLPLFGGPNTRFRYLDSKWWWFPSRFFFAVPRELAEKANRKVVEWFPWAGLFAVERSHGRYLGQAVTVVRKAIHIHDDRMSAKTWVAIVKHQSASLANTFAHLSRCREKQNLTVEKESVENHRALAS